MDQSSQSRTSYLCTFPRFPVHRPGESVPPPPPPPPPPPADNNRTSFCATPRTLPPLTGSRLDHLSQKKQPPPAYNPRQRILPVAQVNTTAAEDQQQPFRQPLAARHPPSKHQRSHSRTVFASATATRPLRLVEESLQHRRKRRPTVFYAQRSRSLVQSLTCITINHRRSEPSSSTTADNNNNMASNPVMPKVAPPPPLPNTALPPLPNSAGRPPYGGGANAQPRQSSKDRLLADLRRQVNYSQNSHPFILLSL